MSGYTVIGRMAREQDEAKGQEENWDEFPFRLSATCPPSTYLHMRGGWVSYPMSWGAPGGGHRWYVNSHTFDMADSNVTRTRAGATRDYIFTNPYWYVPAVLALWWALNPDGGYYDWRTTTLPDDTIYMAGSGSRTYLEEYETAAEAEAAITPYPEDYAAYQCMILGMVVLRNNGNTTDYNQFQEIDPVNRGRSYLLNAMDARIAYVF